MVDPSTFYTTVIKPEIVFFGEGLPEDFFNSIPQLQEADLLIVSGTSLQVQPFASLMNRVKTSCPRVLINMEVVGETPSFPSNSFASMIRRSTETGFDFKGRTRGGKQYSRDVLFLGESDKGFLELAKDIGWEEELLDIQKNWKAQSSEAQLPPSVEDTLESIQNAAEPVTETNPKEDQEIRKLSELVEKVDIKDGDKVKETPPPEAEGTDTGDDKKDIKL